ncbi:MAG: winged helix-turn-helix domain-containing protein [Fimbriimonadaceae bacterium]
MKPIHRVGLFGTLTRTNTLVVVHMFGETHASEIASVLGISLSQAQRALDSLERAGIIFGAAQGRARRVRINPRYPHRDELTALLARIGSADQPLVDRMADIRRRPRRAGKML